MQNPADAVQPKNNQSGSDNSNEDQSQPEVASDKNNSHTENESEDESHKCGCSLSSRTETSSSSEDQRMTYEEIKKTIQYNKNRDELKDFIAINYKDSELIDYETEHRNQLRKQKIAENKITDLNDEFSNDITRVWKFLAKNVVLKDEKQLNKYQKLIKHKSAMNWKY